jgi:beta-ketodecanoyl-[acyl-carrier-protein] synthase
MYSVAISSTGLFVPPHVISNDELVVAFNAYSKRFNEESPPASSVEFIEKASGIKSRYVMDKAGVLDPRACTRALRPRPDDQLSADGRDGRRRGARRRWSRRRSAADIDAVICAAANMQRAYPAMACRNPGRAGRRGYGFDMNVACSSATFGIEQAVNAVKTGSGACACWWSTPRSPRPTWNGATATATSSSATPAPPCWSSAPKTRPSAAWEVLGTRWPPVLQQHPQQLRLPEPLRGQRPGPTATRPSARKAARSSRKWCPMAAAHIEAHLRDLGLTAAHVRRFWLHQANLGMNQLIRKRCWCRGGDPTWRP